MRQFNSDAYIGQTVILRDGSSVDILDVVELKGFKPFFMLKRALDYATPWFVDAEGYWVDPRVVTRSASDEPTILFPAPRMPGIDRPASPLDVIGVAPIKERLFAVLYNKVDPGNPRGVLYDTQEYANVAAARSKDDRVIVPVELEY